MSLKYLIWLVMLTVAARMAFGTASTLNDRSLHWKIAATIAWQAASPLLIWACFLFALTLLLRSTARARLRRGLGVYACAACGYPLRGARQESGAIECPECSHHCNARSLGIEFRPCYEPAEESDEGTLIARFLAWWWKGLPSLATFDMAQKQAIGRSMWRAHRKKRPRPKGVAAYFAVLLLGLVAFVLWLNADMPGSPSAAAIPGWVKVAVPVVLLTAKTVSFPFLLRTQIERRIRAEFPYTICPDCGRSLVGLDVTNGCVVCEKCCYITNLALHGLTPGDLEAGPVHSDAASA